MKIVAMIPALSVLEMRFRKKEKPKNYNDKNNLTFNSNVKKILSKDGVKINL